MGESQRKAAKLAWERIRIAKQMLRRGLGEDFEIYSKGFPDIIVFNRKTGTFRFIELKDEREIGKGLKEEQEAVRRILDRITGKKNFEVWYFGNKKNTKRRVIAKCFYIRNKIEPYWTINEEVKRKLKSKPNT